jgi:hypothetical protein
MNPYTKFTLGSGRKIYFREEKFKMLFTVAGNWVSPIQN